MKMFRQLLVVVFCGAFISSCFEPPEYPIVPEIVFKDIVFIQVAEANSADSLILTLKFKDGDGDLGLNTNEIAPPYNDKWYYVKTPLKQDKGVFDDCTDYASKHRCWYLNDEDPKNMQNTFAILIEVQRPTIH